MIDVSASGFFGTGESLKSDVMIELGSILSFSAIKNNDKHSKGSHQLKAIKD